MKKNFRHWVAAAVGAMIAVAFSSCAYDPYYSSAGGSYSSGYGDGYGYGGSNFSTSLFVSTGDPRWAYDPYCRSYYNYSSRRYYDPYLYGYYPVGYRPQVVIGVPHPYGWNSGRSYCPPPRTVRNVMVKNYHHRESAYRSSNYSWAKQVRVQPIPQTRSRNQNPSRSNYSTQRSPYGGSTPSTRSSSGARQSSNSYTSPNRSRATQPQNVKPDSRQQKSNRLPSGYNTPVNGTSSRHSNPPQQNRGTRSQPTPQPRPSSHAPSRSRGNSSKPAPQNYQRGEDRNSREPTKPSPQSKPDSDHRRGLRSLGQG